MRGGTSVGAGPSARGILRSNETTCREDGRRAVLFGSCSTGAKPRRISTAGALQGLFAVAATTRGVDSRSIGRPSVNVIVLRRISGMAFLFMRILPFLAEVIAVHGGEPPNGGRGRGRGTGTGLWGQNIRPWACLGPIHGGCEGCFAQRFFGNGEALNPRGAVVITPRFT